MVHYKYIHLLKMTAMFAVIIAHCVLYYCGTSYWPEAAEYVSPTCVWINNFFDVFIISVFVFCSGFLFQLSLQKRPYTTSELIRKKALRLLLPFFIFGIFWLVPTYTLFDIPMIGREQGLSLAGGYAAWASGRFADVSWFLMMMFWVTLIWIIFRKMLNKDRLLPGAAAAAALFFAAHFGLRDVERYMLSQIDIYIVVYYIGAAFYFAADGISRKLPKALKIGGASAGLVLGAVLAQGAAECYPLVCLLRIIVPVLSVVLSMGLCENGTPDDSERSAVCKWLTENNLYLYLLQSPALYLAFRLIYPVAGASALVCIALQFLITFAADVILTLAYTAIKKKVRMLLAPAKTHL